MVCFCLSLTLQRYDTNWWRHEQKSEVTTLGHPDDFGLPDVNNTGPEHLENIFRPKTLKFIICVKKVLFIRESMVYYQTLLLCTFIQLKKCNATYIWILFKISTRYHALCFLLKGSSLVNPVTRHACAVGLRRTVKLGQNGADLDLPVNETDQISDNIP